MILSRLHNHIHSKLQEGFNINYGNIAKVKIRVTDYVLINNGYYDIPEQINDITNNSDYNEIEVAQIVIEYYQIVKNLIESGYYVPIKSLGIIQPFLNTETDEYQYSTRLTANILKYKPDNIDFLVYDLDGRILIKRFYTKDIRFSFDIHPNLKAPINIHYKM